MIRPTGMSQKSRSTEKWPDYAYVYMPMNYIDCEKLKNAS